MEAQTSAGTAHCLPFEGGTGEVPTCEHPWELPVPGEGCVSVDVPCPEGEWPDGLPDTGVSYVRKGAAPDGDGSRARPYGDLATALAAADVGATIALGAGRYVGPVNLRRGQSLVGLCAARTELVAEAPLVERALIDVRDGPGVVIRGLRLVDLPGPAVVVEGEGVTAALEGLAVDGFEGVGLVVGFGAEVEVSGSVWRRGRRWNRTEALLFRRGFGLGVFETSRLVVRRSAVLDVMGAGARADGESTLAIENSTLWSVDLPTLRTEGVFASNGRVVEVDGAARLEVRGSALGRGYAGVSCRRSATISIDRSHLADFDVFEAGGPLPAGGSALMLSCRTAELARTTVRGAALFGVQVFPTSGAATVFDTLLLENGAAEAPISQGSVGVAGPASAVLTAVAIERSAYAGVFGTTDTSFSLRDVSIVATQPRATGGGGRGVFLEGSGASLERVSIADSRRRGIEVLAGSVTLTDVRIRGVASVVEPEEGVDRGRGLRLASGATAAATRLAVEGADASGVIAEGEGSRLTGTAVHLRAEGTAEGALVVDGGEVVFEGLHATAASGPALIAVDPTSRLTVRDARLEGGGADAVEGAATVVAERGAAVALTDVGIFGWGGAAVRARHDGTTVTVIGATLAAPERGPADAHRAAVLALDGAQLDAVRVSVLDAVDHAVLAGSGSTVTLVDGCVASVAARGCAVAGACAGEPTGVGVGAYGAGIVLDAVRIGAAEGCALLLDRPLAPVLGPVELQGERGALCLTEGTELEIEGVPATRLGRDHRRPPPAGE